MKFKILILVGLMAMGEFSFAVSDLQIAAAKIVPECQSRTSRSETEKCYYQSILALNDFELIASAKQCRQYTTRHSAAGRCMRDVLTRAANSSNETTKEDDSLEDPPPPIFTGCVDKSGTIVSSNAAQRFMLSGGELYEVHVKNWTAVRELMKTHGANTLKSITDTYGAESIRLVNSKDLVCSLNPNSR